MSDGVKKTGAVPPVNKAELPPLSERRVPQTPVEQGNALREQDSKTKGNVPKPAQGGGLPDDSEGRNIVEEALRRREQERNKPITR